MAPADDYLGGISPVSAIPPLGGMTVATGPHSRPPPPKSSLPPRRNIADLAVVGGFSLEDLPPAVLAVWQRLMEDADELRAALDSAHGYALWLAEQNDQHSVLPVLHRHAFLRELDRLLDRSRAAGGLPGVVVYLHLGGVEGLRAVHGLAAADAVLNQMVEALRASIRRVDLLGYLDGGDFILALGLSDPAGVAEKVDRLVRAAANTVFSWENHSFALAPAAGLAVFAPDRDAAELVALADAARRRPATPKEREDAKKEEGGVAGTLAARSGAAAVRR